MRTLNIPNVPEDVYAEIEKLARVQGRSIAELTIEILSRSLASADADEERLLTEIREARDAMAKRGVFVTEESIRAARNEGRE